MKRLLTLCACVVLASCVTSAGNDSASQPPRSILADDTPAAVNGSAPAVAPAAGQTYSSEELAREASKFFGESSESVALAIERTVSDYGRPVAYIFGNEGSGAVVIGLRFGEGTLQYKGGGSTKVYWQGPSVGWDFGGSASKVFTLIYNLEDTSQLFQRFPAVDGSLYVVAGMSVNYQRSGDIVLAPIRTGVGLRAGASLGYIHYTRERSFIPL